MKWLLLAALFLAFATTAAAEDKKEEGPIKLTVIAKTTKYTLDTGGKTVAEYKKEMEQTVKLLKEKPDKVIPPKPPAIDLVLRLTNTTKEEVTIYVSGDANVYTFELSGDSLSMNSNLAFTADFKLPKPVKLGGGNSYDIPVKQLADGSRGQSRYLYWTGTGDYKLTAKYTLASKDGGRVTEIKSEPVKITVIEKK
jgi:hypothetical protein